MIESLEPRICLSRAGPYGLAADVTSGQAIQLTWRDDARGIAFTIQRSFDGGRFHNLAKTRAHQFRDARAALPGRYAYRIRAAAAFSNVVIAGILSVSLVTTLNSVQISWQPLSGAPQRYSVYRSVVGGGSDNSPFSLALVGATTGASLTDTPPDDGNTYSYRVQSTAHDAGSSSPVTIWPIPVSNFSSACFLGADNHYSVELTWTTNSQYVSQFEIERSSDGGVTWPVVYNVAAPATQFVDADVPDGGTLTYQIAEI